MKFRNRHLHPVSAVDGREVPIHGEIEMTPEQYEHPEQWRQLPDNFVGVTAAAAKLIEDARENPGKNDEGSGDAPQPDEQESTT